MAARFGHVEIVRLMLDGKFDHKSAAVLLDETDDEAIWAVAADAGLTFFTWAESWPRVVFDAIKFPANLRRVFEHPAAGAVLGDDFCAREHASLTQALISINRVGDLSESLRFLVARGYDVNKVFGKFKVTPLLRAAKCGTTAICATLIDLGADTDAVNACGRAPIHVAADHGRADLFEVLVGAGADLSLVSASGKTVLHYACRGGNVAIIRRLVEDLGFREAVNTGTPEAGVTAVMYATLSGRADALRYVIDEAGGDPTAREADGSPATFWAFRPDHDECLAYLCGPAVGLDPGAPAGDGRSLFSYCVGFSLLPQLAYLMEHHRHVCGGPLARGGQKNAFRCAAKSGNLDLLDLLLDPAAGVSMDSLDGFVIAEAARRGHTGKCRTCGCQRVNEGELGLVGGGIGMLPLLPSS